jgi:hypothetical protein
MRRLTCGTLEPLAWIDTGLSNNEIERHRRVIANQASVGVEPQ